jgi:excisionase family DNA binding protein
MKHPTDEIIIAYLYKEAAAEEVGAVERHITECRSCAEKIEGIKNTIFDIDRMDDAAVPEFLENKLSDFFENIANMDNPGANSAEEEAAEKLDKVPETGHSRPKYGKEPERDQKPKDKAGNGGGKTTSDMMTPEELAEYLKIPANSIYDMLGEIPHLILAGRVRFRRSSIDKWLDSREKNPPAKISAIGNFDDSVKLWRNVI